MSEMVHITVNRQPLEVPAGTRVIEAAKMLNIDIPHLCYHPDQTIKAHCRMCMVEVVGSRKLTAACSTVVWEGMEVITDSKKVYDAQTGVLDLILADHKTNCLSCARNGTCELQDLCRRFNRLHPELPDISSNEPLRIDNPSIVRDPSKCVKCGRCVKVCSEVQGCAALTYSSRSAGFKVTTAFDLPMDETDCVLCGQCTLVCPVGALVETDYTNEVSAAIQDPSKHVIVQVAPSVRVALGDEFGLESGAIVTGKMVTALKMLGFEKVFDTNFSADLTIMEEGSELLERIKNGGKLPMITSCSPGWVTYMEKHHPPQGMFGAVAKTYYAQKMGWDPHDVVSVSVMPCTAKKYEASRPELGRDGYQDVDYVLTTRELAKLIRYVGLNLSDLPDSEFDSPLGIGSGAGAIFGATGGVMEAALRTAYELHHRPGRHPPEGGGGQRPEERRGDHPPGGERRGRLHLHRDHGLPRRLHRRRRTAHRHQQRRPGRPHPGPVRDRPEPPPAQEPREPGDQDHLRGVLRRAPVQPGPRPAPHPLPRPQKAARFLPSEVKRGRGPPNRRPPASFRLYSGISPCRSKPPRRSGNTSALTCRPSGCSR